MLVAPPADTSYWPHYTDARVPFHAPPHCSQAMNIAMNGSGSAFYCHGAIALWRRTTVERILARHDSMFHGEDLYMGLLLHRRRKGELIVAVPDCTVYTVAPDSWSLLLRQRSRSWDVVAQRKIISFIKFIACTHRRECKWQQAESRVAARATQRLPR